MRWPWQAADQRRGTQRRGTLILFDDCWVLGLPHDTHAADGQHMHDLMVKAWPNLPNVMVYPFPIDVTDKRTKGTP